jgi:hypothetical protein
VLHPTKRGLVSNKRGLESQKKALLFAQTGFGSGRFGGQAFALASRTRSGAIHMQMPEFFDLRCTGLVQQTPSRSDVLCAVMCLSKNSC